MKNVFLITTDHLEDHLWFYDDDDFKAGMNFVAVLAFRHGLTIIAFILMSNHVHFLVYGQREDAKVFIDGYKNHHSKYLRHKYGFKELLRRNGVDIQLVSDLDEGVEKAVAYVHMNSVAANICSYPAQYPWGTGDLLFNPVKRKGKRLGDLSNSALRRLLHTYDTKLPSDWIIGEDDYILPESYVDIEYDERVFCSPKRMNFFLTNSSKAKRRLEVPEKNLPAFRDQIIIGALPDLCRSLFQKKSIQDLSMEEKKEFVRQIRFRFSSEANQIARVAGISYTEAAKLLDGM